jgi:hypothetical protein
MIQYTLVQTFVIYDGACLIPNWGNFSDTATTATITQGDNKLVNFVWASRFPQKNVRVMLGGPHTKRPNASGIELIASGGITPASVTTAVMLDGGVRSYNGLRISRFG